MTTTTSTTSSTTSKIVLCAGMTALLVACASKERAGAAAKSPESPAQESSPAAGYGAQQQPGQPGYTPPPAASAPGDAAKGATTPGTPATDPYAQPPNRSAALTQANNDVESSQRELDVAGGDCRNACRALGSMDRAAGRLCNLAQSNDEVRRCGDAKTRVYSARDKVKNTCGSCPDTSVDKSAPIPSR